VKNTRTKICQKEKAKIDSLKKVWKEERLNTKKVFILIGIKNQKHLGVELVEGKIGKLAFDDDLWIMFQFFKQERGFFDHIREFSARVSGSNSKKRDKALKANIIGNSNNFLGFSTEFGKWILDSSNHVLLRLIHRLPDGFWEVVTDANCLQRLVPNRV